MIPVSQVLWFQVKLCKRYVDIGSLEIERYRYPVDVDTAMLYECMFVNAPIERKKILVRHMLFS